jgi:hypothetical protein
VGDLLRDVGTSVSPLGSEWTKYSVVGSFVLYLFGYLAVRFHLTAIGIGTDLAVLDERYLFAGARFLVYLVSSIPSMLLILLPVAFLLGRVPVLRRAIDRAASGSTEGRPVLLAWGGVVLAVIAIQFVMRQCFFVSNLLLAPVLPSLPPWLVRLLFNDQLMPLYFDSLVAMGGVSLAILFLIRKAEPIGLTGLGRALLAFLALVQILLLPVNYGILIMDKSLPRVASVANESLADGDAAWLVWEGKDGVTFLVRRGIQPRVLLTVPRADIKRTEIVGFDPIVPTLFGGG